MMEADIMGGSISQTEIRYRESLRMFLQECVESLLMFLVQAGQMPGYMPEGWLQMQFLMLQIKKEAGERTPDEIRDYMNRYLPDDIAVKEVREASERFHARYKAVGKLYRYTCYDGPVKPVFQRKYVSVLEKRPDVEKMQQAAAYLEGKHDYKSFCGNPRMKKSTVRVVDKIEITRKGSFIYFDFHGTGFLQNMVRILVGTLLEVGKGKIKPEQIPEILEAKNRQMAGPTAPAQGLCLIKVDY